MKLCPWSTPCALVAVLLAACPSRAAPPDPDLVDVAGLPLVEVLPDPVYGPLLALPADERARAQALDYSAGPIARWARPAERAALSVVIARNAYHPDDHEAQGWFRFTQGNPEVPPISASCGRGAHQDRVVDTYQLAPGPGGSMRYAHDHASFDFATCKGRLVRHHETPVLPLAGGLVYAYRTRCAGCGEGREDLLHLVMPSGYGSITSDTGRWVYWTRLVMHVAVPLAPGSSSTLTLRFEPDAVTEWNRAVPSPVPVEGRRLRVEVSLAHGEAQPTVLVVAE